MFLEEPAHPAAGSETTTEEDMFGKPVVLGKGMYIHVHQLSAVAMNGATTISDGNGDWMFYDQITMFNRH